MNDNICAKHVAQLHLNSSYRYIIALKPQTSVFKKKQPKTVIAKQNPARVYARTLMHKPAMLPTSIARSSRSSRTQKAKRPLSQNSKNVTLRKLSRTSGMRSKGHYLRGRTQRCLIDKGAGCGIDLQPRISPCTAAAHTHTHSAFVLWKWVWKAKRSRAKTKGTKNRHLSPTEEPKPRCTPR